MAFVAPLGCRVCGTNRGAFSSRIDRTRSLCLACRYRADADVWEQKVSGGGWFDCIVRDAVCTACHEKRVMPSEEGLFLIVFPRVRVALTLRALWLCGVNILFGERRIA